MIVKEYLEYECATCHARLKVKVELWEISDMKCEVEKSQIPGFHLMIWYVGGINYTCLNM